MAGPDCRISDGWRIERVQPLSRDAKEFDGAKGWGGGSTYRHDFSNWQESYSGAAYDKQHGVFEFFS